MFTPFNTTKSNGIGLGLPYCKQAVEAHKGSINVRSKEGEGTQFIIRFPREEKENPTNNPHDNIVELLHPN